MALAIDLNGKTAIITGASSGIGMGMAIMFARAGAKVIGCSELLPNHPQSLFFLDRVGAEGDVSYVQADVTHKADLENLINFSLNKYGAIDILLSNAGRNIFEGAENCSNELWNKNLQLNLQSHWELARLCKPYLEKSGEGVIIFTASNHAYASIPGCFPYNVVKTALTGLVRSLAIEWGPKIRTLGIAPGFIDTAGNQAWFARFENPAAEKARTIEMHPVKKLGTPEEIGAWCVFLASSYAAFASGNTYLIDGGRSALLQDY